MLLLKETSLEAICNPSAMKKFLFLLGSISLFGFSNAQDATSNGPIIKFENTAHAFGTVIEGQIATHEFTFQNTGTEPLVLNNVQASCGCTTPSWPREPIGTGESAKIVVKYDSNGRPGNFNKSVFIFSNGGDVTLTISGNVIREPEKPKSLIINN